MAIPSWILISEFQRRQFPRRLAARNRCLRAHALLLSGFVAGTRGVRSNFESVSQGRFRQYCRYRLDPRFQRELRELCPGAFVQLSNDNGRDIGGFTRLLDNVDIKKYDLFAFMHSKKSPHIAAEKGDYWRRSLLRAFAGSPDIVAECVQMFKDDPTVGLIGARRVAGHTSG